MTGGMGGTHGTDEIGRTARDWIVRLSSGEMTDGDMRRLKGWLAESGVHRVVFEKERRFWQAPGGLREDFAPERPLDGAATRRRRPWRVAAVGGNAIRGRCPLPAE